jgi:uncharacterized protein YciI
MLHLPFTQIFAYNNRQYNLSVAVEKMQLFAVIRTHGAAWQPSSPIEGQEQWDAHARFMDALEAKGVIVLGGPLEGTPDVLLVMRVNSAEEAAQHFQDDPWTRLDLLRTKQITPWTLRLGTLPDSVPPG